MLQALRQNIRRQAVSRTAQLPAPIGGLNARDPLAGMAKTDAVVMDNFYPGINTVSLRRGFSSFCVGAGAAVQTLMTYHALNGSEKFFACANNKIQTITAGSVSATYSTTITLNKWQWINFSNAGTLYILAVNGTDYPRRYAGTNWSLNAIAGSITSSGKASINIFQHKERVWLVEKNTLNLWYLASQAISGTATKFPLGAVFENGGQILAGGTLSFDAGAGIDDYLVAVTDNGEAVVYAGTNPASDFLLQGRYEIGMPIGNRCLTKVGGDLIVTTSKGAVPMSLMINNDRAKADAVAVTSKIAPKFNKAVSDWGANFGWQGFVYPKGGWVIFNVPEIEGAIQRQYVQNVITGAWCRFTGMNANCWGLFNDNLYFGGNDGKIYKADTGMSDASGNIEADLKPAFTDCGSLNNKFFSALRPLMLNSGTAAVTAGINVDFQDTIPNGTVSAAAGTAWVWNTSTWDHFTWGGTGLLVRDWITTGDIGVYVAPRLKVAANGISVEVNGFEILYQESKGQIY